MMVQLLRSLSLAAAAGAGFAHATLQIVPGATWTAANTGKHVQAHGAGMVQVGSTYYMIGEDKTGGSAFQNVNCYSSTNLVEWTYVGALLSQTSGGDLGPNRVVERPKVIYNDATKKYVMYLHIDNSGYSEAKVGVATSDTVCGKYTYLKSFRPLNFESRDIGLFKDDDGAGYLLTEDVSSMKRGHEALFMVYSVYVLLILTHGIACQWASHRCTQQRLSQRL